MSRRRRWSTTASCMSPTSGASSTRSTCAPARPGASCGRWIPASRSPTATAASRCGAIWSSRSPASTAASSPPTRRAARSSGTRSSATSPISSSPPRRWRSKIPILIGASGGDNGVRDWLAALDPKTGDTQWKTFIVPAPGEPGSETWKDKADAWRTGGGALYVTGSYDPADQPHLLGHRQSGAALRLRLPPGRQSVHRQHGRVRRRDRQDPVVLPVHRRTTITTMTPPARRSSSTARSTARTASSSCMPTATASTTRSTASTASSSMRCNMSPS